MRTPHSVYYHTLKHSGPRDHKCVECGAAFKRLHHLKAHQKQKQHGSVPRDQVEKIKCPECKEEFSELRLFRTHLNEKHSEVASTYRYDYVCPICGMDFSYKVLLGVGWIFAGLG